MTHPVAARVAPAISVSLEERGFIAPLSWSDSDQLSLADFSAGRRGKRLRPPSRTAGHSEPIISWTRLSFDRAGHGFR